MFELDQMSKFQHSPFPNEATVGTLDIFCLLQDDQFPVLGKVMIGVIGLVSGIGIAACIMLMKK